MNAPRTSAPNPPVVAHRATKPPVSSATRSELTDRRRVPPPYLCDCNGEIGLRFAVSNGDGTWGHDRGFLYGYEFFEAGIDLRFKHYSYRWHYSYAAQMHHKYFIIDDSIIATGSYNLSDNAEHGTMENVVILSGDRYAGVVQNFVDNFNAMWDTGRDDDMALYNDLMADVESGTSFSIVYDSMALTWDEIDSLKRTLRSNCSDLDTEEFRRNPERHHYCQP